ncbi:Short-chain dehydrogenase TIC 32 [Hibiscus syriacus]|uniref:Short-chain dehydrogenase TIC 32 n=1 Tax=Hibiscus syriacus TaxID=106335 RepID=A0A6A3B543_HIBSY|nr:Short-chain dehydrogenase TIC 32 [Hibiscus syriacus]
MWLFSWKGASSFSAYSTAEDITQGIDGTGLTAIVTGVSSGIGVETARVLAFRGVHVVMAVRNVDVGRNVKETILEEINGAKIDVMELDLSSMASVRKFASEFQSSNFPLNILINNAGVMATPFILSLDNVELQFATNHLAKEKGGLLIYLQRVTGLHIVREFALIKSMMNQGKTDERLHRFDPLRNILLLVCLWKSKLANILHTNELARRLKEEGVEITANSLHPGSIIMTNLMRHQTPMYCLDAAVGQMVGKYFLKSIPQGAATTCYVALHPQVKSFSGEYFMDSNISQPSFQGKDEDLAKGLGLQLVLNQSQVVS